MPDRLDVALSVLESVAPDVTWADVEKLIERRGPLVAVEPDPRRGPGTTRQGRRAWMAAAVLLAVIAVGVGFMAEAKVGTEHPSNQPQPGPTTASPTTETELAPQGPADLVGSPSQLALSIVGCQSATGDTSTQRDGYNCDRIGTPIASLRVGTTNVSLTTTTRLLGCAPNDDTMVLTFAQFAEVLNANYSGTVEVWTDGIIYQSLPPFVRATQVKTGGGCG
jgi:hypothetical protein